MFLYFYKIDEAFFHGAMAPCMARSHRQRSFEPCRKLCHDLVARNPGVPGDALVRAVLAGLDYDRHYWHGLIGECLVHGAKDIPRLSSEPAGLCCLLEPERFGVADSPRHLFAPIQRAYFGSRDLRFGGGYYRPDHAGLNDRDDVASLARYATTIQPETWQCAQLQLCAGSTNDDERAEELAYLREAWFGLVELYQGARQENCVVVCEQV